MAGHAADDAHHRVAVEEDLFDEGLEAVGVGVVTQLYAEVFQKLEGAKAGRAADLHAVLNVMRLHVDDELILRPAFIISRLLEGLGFGDFEEIAEALIHSDEGGRHAGAGAQELAARHAELPGLLVGHVVNQVFDLALLRGLRQRVELFVGNRLRRDGRVNALAPVADVLRYPHR